MSLVFHRRGQIPYLHVQPPRSPLRVIVAFLAGAVCAGFLLHRPADPLRFTQPAALSATVGKAGSGLPGAEEDRQTTAVKEAGEAEPRTADESNARNGSDQKKRKARVLGASRPAMQQEADRAWFPERRPTRPAYSAPFQQNAPVLTY
jgi:hypothetical protein